MIRKILSSAGLLLLFAALTFAQQPGGNGFTIDGRLLDGATNQPIAHARVTIAPVTHRNDFTTVVTAEDGLFSFSGLKPGKYALSAQAHGYFLQSFNQHDQYSSSIAVGERANSRGLVFRVYKEAVIDGTVLDEAGEAVRDAHITLYKTGTDGASAGTSVPSNAMTNDEGHYHIGHLPPGDYTISASGRVWYARRPNVSRKYLSSGLITGQAASITLNGGTVIASESGATSLDAGMPNALDLVYPATFFPGVTEATSAGVIHLAHGEKYVADFNLQPVKALHLIVPALENPQSYLNFQLRQKMMDGTTAMVNTETTRLANGEWEILGIAPGQYTLITTTFTSRKPDERPGPMEHTSTTREISAVGDDVVDDEKAASAAVVKAQLQFDPGAAAANQSYLVLFNVKTRRNTFEQIQQNGEIEFKEHVPAGSYEVSVNGAGGSFIRSMVVTGARSYGRSIMIRGGAPVQLAIAVGKGEGQITGVALHDGQPMAGVMIVAVPSDPAHNQILFRRDQTDSDGSFTLSNVVPGNYTVLALENGWDLQWLKPEVLKPFMAAGDALQVMSNGKYELKLKVQ